MTAPITRARTASFLIMLRLTGRGGGEFRVLWHGDAACGGDAEGELLEVPIGVLHGLTMGADGTVCGPEKEHGLVGLLGQTGQADVGSENGKAVWIRLRNWRWLGLTEDLAVIGAGKLSEPLSSACSPNRKLKNDVAQR